MKDRTGGLLQDRVAIVTGGTRGIGRAITDAFAAAGAQVVAVSRRGADAVSDDLLPPGTWTLACDVSDEAAVERLTRQVIERFDRIDVLVNNAGTNDDAMLHRMDLDAFRRVIDVNLQGTWLLTRAVLGVMRTRRAGSIVNISSMSGHRGNVGQANYAASKAGVEALTKVTAREGASHGVRANAIRPGLISTDMTAAVPAATWDAILATVPLGRAGSADEVANVATFLASDLASYVTGTVVDVSGGRGI